jgi:hypothetical protein
VLLDDREAEHVPGCNMAFRREVLECIGGFDARFRIAGDDVDACWRLTERGFRIGFSPAAMVWHHRRPSLRAFWKQQRGYGRAESILERKWPNKYNPLGHVNWTGRMYGPGGPFSLGWRRNLVYHGVWGQNLFQSVYRPRDGWLESMSATPEWYLLLALLAVFGSLGVFWHPLLLSWVAVALGCALSVLEAVAGALRAVAAKPLTLQSRDRWFARLAMITLLFLTQPLARLVGRAVHGLTPWRLHGTGGTGWPRARTIMAWSERWRPHVERVADLERTIRSYGILVRRGGDFDRWDLEVRGGLFGAVRVLCAVEEHGAGRQLLRVRMWPRMSTVGRILVAILDGLCAGAALESAWLVSAGLGLAACAVVWRMLRECGTTVVVRASEGMLAD